MQITMDRHKIDAEVEKLRADCRKLEAETRKLTLQTRWLPMIEGAALLGMAHAIIKLYFH